ncbi:MAG: HK97 gp10 family phage protein [Bacilli bacterium]|nr:HK97 gp10 family phage protein [Bacilli bacterium]
MASITIKGIESLTRKLNNISQTEKVKETMNNAVLLVHAQAKTLAPVDKGALAGSIRPKVITEGKKIIGKVYTNLSYAPFVEFGTGIKGTGTYPNKNVTLTYRSTPWVYTPDDGETFYYTEGQVAQPYMYPAIKRNERKIKTMFKEALHTDLKNNSK